MKQKLPLLLQCCGINGEKLLAKIFLFAIFLFFNVQSKAQTVQTDAVSVTPVCAGTAVTVDFSVINGTGAATYFTNATIYTIYLSDASGNTYTSIASFSTTGISYSNADAGVTTGISQSVTIPSNTISGSGYKISIGSSSPNFDGSTGANASAAFSINAQLTPAVSIAVNPGISICSGTNVSFTATATNGGATPGYQWTINGVNVPGANLATFSTNTLIQGNQVRVVLSSSDPCANPASVTSTPISMTVNDIVVPSINITSTTTTACAAAAITFNAGFPVNGGNAPGFQWQVNGLDVAGETGNSFTTAVLNNNDVVTVLMTSNATCASPNPVSSNGITVTINPNAGLVLSSANNNQSICINAAVSAINYTVSGGATNASVTGLPSGLSGVYNAGNLSISGTATQSGTFNYSVITTGTCTQASSSGTIVVNPDATLAHTSGATTQSICTGNSIVPIIYTTGGTATSATVTGLPPGIAAVYNAGSITISGSASSSGTFNFTVTATGTCANSASLTGTITVTDFVTPSVSIVADNNSICTGNTVNFTATPVNAGASPSYQWQVDAINAGTNSSSFSTNTLTNGQVVTVVLTSNANCVSPTTASSNAIPITVSGNATLTHVSGSVLQTLCVNTTAIENIVYNIGGTGTNASASGLPPGVTGTYNAGSFTISGTPTTAGTFNYSVTATGTCANSPALTGTITVNDNATISLSSAINTDNQTVCINTAIVNTTYTIGGGATGATVTGLAGTGLSATVIGNTVSISGSPNAAGTINYTVQTTGPCLTPSLTGSVNVNPNATLALQSGATSQTICIGASISSIIYTIGATGNNATVTGLPAGVSGTYNAGIFTISGTATVAGSFNYTVTASGTCANAATLGGTITINANATLTLTSVAATTSQTKCITPATAITPITYAVGGSATGATVTGLPTGVTGSFNAGVFSITGTPSVSGTFTYNVTTSGGCSAATLGGTISIASGVLAQPSVITGPTAICPVVNGLVYSVTNNPAASSYTWTVPTGFTIVSGATSNSITVNVGASAVNGNITVRANNICGQSALRTLGVNIGNFAFANAGPDQTICAGSVVTLAGSIGGVINNQNEWDWNTSGTGTFSNPNSVTSNYTPSAADIAAGTVTITIVTDEPSVSCPAVSDQMVITIKPLPTATISGATTICSGSSASINFTGTPNTTVTYNTSQTINIGASGTATLNTGTLNSNTTYTLNSIAYQSAPTCSRSIAGSVTIVVNQAAAVTAGATLSACQSATPTAIILAGASITGGTNSGQWSIISGGGILSNTGFTTTPATVTYTPAAGFSGAVTLRLTSADPDAAGPCIAVFQNRTININEAAIANAGAPQTVCAGGSITLNGSIAGSATSSTWTAPSGSFS